MCSLGTFEVWIFESGKLLRLKFLEFLNRPKLLQILPIDFKYWENQQNCYFLIYAQYCNFGTFIIKIAKNLILSKIRGSNSTNRVNLMNFSVRIFQIGQFLRFEYCEVSIYILFFNYSFFKFLIWKRACLLARPVRGKN